MSEPGQPTRIGGYAIYEAIASGGMATVHLGCLLGPEGFTRTVAIKRMHPHLAKEPEFVAMFLDEARLAARIRHPNVVSTLDVVATGGELLIVMDYVHGESLASLLKTVSAKKERVPVPVACAIVADLLAGLHAAHEARDEHGEPLWIVHRDVSPQNVLVGADGVTRVLDFGVAKAVGRIQQTREGQVKGKIAYMAPEQVRAGDVTRAVDIYAASVVLWETLTARRLFKSDRDVEVVEKILFGTIDAPSARAPSVPEVLNPIVLRGLSRDPSERYPTAREMVQALRDSVAVASASEVGDWLEAVAGAALAERAAMLAGLGRDLDVAEIRKQRRRADGSEHTEETAAIVLPPDAVGSVSGDPIRSMVPAGLPRRSRSAVLLLSLGAIAMLALGLVAIRASSRPAMSTAPPPPALASVAASAVASAALPVGVELPAPAASPSVSPPDPTPPVRSPASAPTSAHGGAARPPTGPPRSHGRPGCEPPYTTDPDGTRHYKLQCL